jgi:hypothetical protein
VFIATAPGAAHIDRAFSSRRSLITLLGLSDWLPRIPARRGKRDLYLLNHSCEVLFDLEIPEAQNGPPQSLKFGRNSAISFLVSSDLLIPVRAATTLPILSWVPMPESAIDKYDEVSPPKCEIRLTGEGLSIASPSSNPISKQRSAQR